MQHFEATRRATHDKKGGEGVPLLPYLSEFWKKGVFTMTSTTQKEEREKELRHVDGRKLIP